MALRRHRRKNPRGTLLAFIALAIQALIPFFLAIEIARAANPVDAGSIPLCSTLDHHSNGAGDQTGNGSCPICAAVAAGLTYSAPPPLAVPLPQRCDDIDLSVAVPRSALSFIAPVYQSRGPPAIV